MSKKYSYEEYTELMKQKSLEAMEKACVLLERDTKLLTHVDSGDLRRSWTHSVDKDSKGVVGRVGTNLEYAPIENWRHPNLTKAVDDDLGQIIEIIEQTLKDV